MERHGDIAEQITVWRADSTADPGASARVADSSAHVTTLFMMQHAAEQRLAGDVVRVVNRREDTGWAVIEVHNGGARCTAVGELALADEGLRIEARGRWVEHRQFGRQFRVRSARMFSPNRAVGIERFLRSGAVAQVGPVFAKKIVEKFGDKTLHVIEHEPWRLNYLHGVGPKRIAGVIEGVKAHRGRLDVMAFLHSRLGPVRAQRVFERYGTEAQSKIAADPYRLMLEFDGFGWALSDRVARDVGVSATHPRRLQAGVMAALQRASSIGHTRLDEPTARKWLAKLLGSDDLAHDALALPPRGWAFVGGTGDAPRALELKRFAFLDGRVAARLRRLVQAESATPALPAGVAVPWAESRIGLTFEPSQARAIAGALQEKIAIVTGGPGVGKTTILKGLLEIWNAKRVRVALAAPTGRAARRMTESTGRDAQTLHRLLAYLPDSGFSHNAENPLDVDALIVDESSMVDLALMRATLEALPDDARLVLVGDRDQLPSVGPGQVFGDLIDADVVAVRRLTKPFRQAAHSPIIANAHLVNAGEAPDLTCSEPGFEFVATADTAATADALERVVCDQLPCAGVRPATRHHVPVPVAQRPGRSDRDEHAPSAAAEPLAHRHRDGGRAALRDRRQGHAAAQQRGAGHQQRRHRGHRTHRPQGPGTAHSVRPPARRLPVREPFHAGDGLLLHRPQEPGLGVPGRGHCGGPRTHDPSGPKAAVHRDHPRDRPCDSGGATPRRAHRCQRGAGQRAQYRARRAHPISLPDLARAVRRLQAGASVRPW